MPVYLVRCRFANPVRARPAVDAELATLPECLRPLEDTWIVEGATSARLIRSMIEPHMQSGDGLLILRAGQEADWRDIETFSGAWLADRFTRGQ